MATPVKVTTVDKEGNRAVTISDESGKVKTESDARKEYNDWARRQVREQVKQGSGEGNKG